MNISESAATRPSAFVADSHREEAGNSMHQQPPFHMDLCDGGVPTSLFCKRDLGLKYNANLHIPA